MNIKKLIAETKAGLVAKYGQTWINATPPEKERLLNAYLCDLKPQATKPNYMEIIGQENVTYAPDGEPRTSDAGYDRLAEALLDGRIAAPPEVIASARATKAQVANIRRAIDKKLN